LHILQKKQTTYCNWKRQFLFKQKNIQSDMCNKLFDASHVSLLFKKQNSIET